MEVRNPRRVRLMKGGVDGSTDATNWGASTLSRSLDLGARKLPGTAVGNSGRISRYTARA